MRHRITVKPEAVLDLDVQVTDNKRRTVAARVVCMPFGGEDRYYLTTLPRAIFTPHDVAELYRIRWEVELFFGSPTRLVEAAGRHRRSTLSNLPRARIGARGHPFLDAP